MGLFDSTEEHPPSKVLRYIITGVVFIVLIVLFAAYELRFHTEEKTIRYFMDAVVAGKMDEAFRIWKPAESYSFKDFLEDWGPDGYYGPIKSYHLEHMERLPDASGGASSGVVATIELSPYQPFPGDNDAAKQSKTKEVKIWVEFRNQSLGFPP
ncbi:MAG: hypothetical protein ABSB65_03045 [Candidatus Acidiferrales bacterium]